MSEPGYFRDKNNDVWYFDGTTYFPVQWDSYLNNFIIVKNSRIDFLKCFESFKTNAGHLKIFPHLNTIMDSFQKNFLTVISAPTGTGKSLGAIIKIALETKEKVWCSVPNVQSAKNLCKIANQITNNTYFSGWGARGESFNEECLILYATAGRLINLLLKCNETERDLEKILPYTIVIDEAHDKASEVYFLICLMNEIFTKFPNLMKTHRLVIMSATLHLNLLQEIIQKFDGELIEVDIQRQYSTVKDLITVDGYYFNDLFDVLKKQLISHLNKMENDYFTENHGNVILFVSGKEDILEIKQLMRRYPKWFVLGIHSEMTKDEEEMIDAKSHYTLFVCTNAAESSITLPGVIGVIDLGYEKRIQDKILKLYPISMASLKQRMGRGGRVANCHYILYNNKHVNRNQNTESDFFTNEDIRVNSLISLTTSNFFKSSSTSPHELFMFDVVEELQEKYDPLIISMIRLGILKDNSDYSSSDELTEEKNEDKIEVTDVGKKLSKHSVSYQTSFLLIHIDEGFKDEKFDYNQFISSLLFASFMETGNLASIFAVKPSDENYDVFKTRFYSKIMAKDSLEVISNVFINFMNTFDDKKQMSEISKLCGLKNNKIHQVLDIFLRISKSMISKYTYEIRKKTNPSYDESSYNQIPKTKRQAITLLREWAKNCRQQNLVLNNLRDFLRPLSLNFELIQTDKRRNVYTEPDSGGSHRWIIDTNSYQTEFPTRIYSFSRFLLESKKRTIVPIASLTII